MVREIRGAKINPKSSFKNQGCAKYGGGRKLREQIRFLTIKPTRCTNFSNLFLDQNSTCFGQFFCPKLASGITMELSSILIPLASSQHHLYDIYLLLCIQYQTPDDGQKTCPKHVEFQSKNKFEKLVHLIGFITRIYHDARSSECQMSNTPSCKVPGIFV